MILSRRQHDPACVKISVSQEMATYYHKFLILPLLPPNVLCLKWLLASSPPSIFSELVDLMYGIAPSGNLLHQKFYYYQFIRHFRLADIIDSRYREHYSSYFTPEMHAPCSRFRF